MYAFCGIDAVWLLVDARQMFSSRTHTGLAYVFVAVSGEDKARTLLPCFVKKGIRFIQVFKLCCFGIVFNSKKWYREFYVNQFTIPIIFSW